ncbi:MAG TPA: hypothetical protein VFQ62_11140 [Methylomirabilota bacterium]|jgi:hypothetical protein|nr:hypothetical protein [Methylomirabilota bacterium]
MQDTSTCDRLVWNELHTPDSEEVALIRRAIVENGLHTRDAVANAVAEELFRRDCRRTSYLDGFGFFRHWYVAGVKRLLDRLEGTAVRTVHAP